jgi:hypothetical protein
MDDKKLDEIAEGLRKKLRRGDYLLAPGQSTFGPAIRAALAEAELAGYERGRAEEYGRTVQERERWNTLLVEADAKLVAVVEALEKARAQMADYAPRMWSEDIAAIDAVLAATREQPTQDKPPLGHEFLSHAKASEVRAEQYHPDELVPR